MDSSSISEFQSIWRLQVTSSFEVLLLFFSICTLRSTPPFDLTRNKRNWATLSPPFALQAGYFVPTPPHSAVGFFKSRQGVFVSVFASLLPCRCLSVRRMPARPSSSAPEPDPAPAAKDLAFYLVGPFLPPSSDFPSSGLPSLLSDKDAEKLLTACQGNKRDQEVERRGGARDVRPGPQED